MIRKYWPIFLIGALAIFFLASLLSIAPSTEWQADYFNALGERLIDGSANIADAAVIACIGLVIYAVIRL